MAGASGVRQDKTRVLVADLETTVGTFKFTPASDTNQPIWPCRAGTRLMPDAADFISNNDALDGEAGTIAATRGAAGMGGTVECEIHDYSGSLVYPPWVRMLHASGFESTHASSTVTMVPSTKAITDWPGETAGSRSPAAASLAEVIYDNNTADELVAERGAVFATKIVFDTNGIAMLTGTPTALVVNDEFLDTTSNTDLSSFGAKVSGEAIDPVVVKGATITMNYVEETDSGTTTTAVTPARFRGLEIDLAPTVVREEDPTETNGYGVASVFYEGDIPVSFELADTGAIAEDVMAGYYSGRGFFDIEIVIVTTSPRQITIDMPRIQYTAERQGSEGARMFAISGNACRATRGNTTAPITVTWTYA